MKIYFNIAYATQMAKTSWNTQIRWLKMLSCRGYEYVSYLHALTRNDLVGICTHLCCLAHLPSTACLYNMNMNINNSCFWFWISVTNTLASKQMVSSFFKKWIKLNIRRQLPVRVNELTTIYKVYIYTNEYFSLGRVAIYASNKSIIDRYCNYNKNSPAIDNINMIL